MTSVPGPLLGPGGDRKESAGAFLLVREGGELCGAEPLCMWGGEHRNPLQTPAVGRMDVVPPPPTHTLVFLFCFLIKMESFYIYCFGKLFFTLSNDGQFSSCIHNKSPHCFQT